MIRRRASTPAPATTEDAPASSPNGCRRKRAIITYARRASKAYRPMTMSIVRPTFGGAGAPSPASRGLAIRSTTPLTPEPIVPIADPDEQSPAENP